MDFKIKRDYRLQRLSYANVDFARPKVDHADTSYMRSFSLARSNGMERKADMQPSSSRKRMICHPLASRKKRYFCPLSNLSRRGLAEASRKPRGSLVQVSRTPRQIWISRSKMITDYKIPSGGGSHFRLISQFFSKLDLQIKHDDSLTDYKIARGGEGGGLIYD